MRISFEDQDLSPNLIKITDYKPKKVLTNLRASTKVSPVKDQMKGRRHMASTKKTKQLTKNIKKLRARTEVVTTVAWTIEVAFRTFVGVIMLTRLDGFFVSLAGLYALGTSAAIVVGHIFKANK